MIFWPLGVTFGSWFESTGQARENIRQYVRHYRIHSSGSKKKSGLARQARLRVIDIKYGVKYAKEMT
jgi:hypothetical protein